MKKLKIITLLLFSSLLLVLAGCGSNEETTDDVAAKDDVKTEDSVTLTIVSFLPENHQFTRDIVPMWMEQIEEGTDGAVKLDWIGGPESIPTPEQFDAVSSGIVDIGFNTSSFYGHLMPETLSLHMSPFTPEEERVNGYFDYLNGRYEAQNQVYLGRFLGPNPFYFWSNEKLETLDAFDGLSFRSNPTYHEILQALNVNPVEVVPGEVYTSLERNMVDGFGFPLLGPHESGWTEVTRYIIDEPFLNQNGTILINKDTFESLSEEIREKVLEITAEFEHDMIEHFLAENELAWEAIESEGVEKIKLTNEDSQKFQKIVTEVYWDMFETEVPDQVDKIKELLLVD